MPDRQVTKLNWIGINEYYLLFLVESEVKIGRRTIMLLHVQNSTSEKGEVVV
jgi:hypothetical protein